MSIASRQEQLIIEGGNRLHGEVIISGSKNAALKMIPACLLTAEPVILENVPDIKDIRTLCTLMEKLGAKLEWLDATTLQIDASEITTQRVDPKLASQIRASIVLAGPMLGRFKQIEIAAPGGDVIGRRPLDTHILALEALGAEIAYDVPNATFQMKTAGLKGANVLLYEASVTATENTIMAAVLAEGTTTIRNAASEPHVQNLCNMLNSMGAKISGVGSNQLTIEGVEQLHGTRVRVGADYLEVVSYIGIAAVTGSDLWLRQADPHFLDMSALVFKKLGVTWEVHDQDVFVPRGQSLKINQELGGAIPEIKPQIWPGFPTDMMSIAIVVATQAAGTALFHEWMFDTRLFFTDRLSSMGARVLLCDPHRTMVQGPTPLKGDQVISSPDIRAGMALLIAALAAQGVTTIRNIHQIDRGYVNVEGKLQQIGANIRREVIRE